MFTFVDTMSSILSSKLCSLEDSFRPLIDVFDTNKTSSTDKVVKRATVLPDDIEKHKLYPNVAKVYRLLLSSSPSVCKSEWSFSRLKLLKNYLRSTISQDRLNALMMLNCERDIVDAIDIQHVVDRWANVRKCRIRID